MPNLNLTAEAERDRVVSALADHFALGRLTLDELNQRVDAALRAKTSAELEALLLDLPAESVASPPPQTGPGLRPVARMPRSAPWIPWAVTAVICMVIWLGTSISEGTALYFWPAWVIGPWGVAIAAR